MDGLPPAITPALGRVIEICAGCHVRTLDMFGSAVTDRFDPDRSDLDFLVAFDSEPGRSRARDYLALHQGLEAVFERPVDLVELSSLANPFFRRHVLATRRRLYPAGMISQAAAKHVWDARRIVGRIIDMTAARDFAEYEQDDVLRLAIERALGILGEAFVRLRRESPEVATQVPGLAQAIAFRNIIVHQYDSLDQSIVWEVVQSRLPVLRKALDDLLEKAPGDE